VVRACALACALVLAPALASAQATWHATRITSGDVPLYIEHLWSKGAKFRAQTVIGGHPILTLVSGERYVMVDVLAGRGISIQRSPAAVALDEQRARPFGHEYETLVAGGAEKVGLEERAGRRCEVWRSTEISRRRELCVTADEARLPLEYQESDRGAVATATTRYVDWSRDMAIPDSFFEPDPRFQLEHIDYQSYLRRASKEQIGPAPPFFRDLLHGK
jgi:hypothetical protein